jgi:hypothetical protein
VTTWTYEELTAHTEEEVKRLVELSLRAKKENDASEWGEWRAYAYGTLRSWERLTRDHRTEDDDWENRLYDLIPDDVPPSLEDHSVIMEDILKLVMNAALWRDEAMTAFNRGLIVGMCAKAGIPLPDLPLGV